MNDDDKAVIKLAADFVKLTHENLDEFGFSGLAKLEGLNTLGLGVLPKDDVIEICKSGLKEMGELSRENNTRIFSEYALSKLRDIKSSIDPELESELNDALGMLSVVFSILIATVANDKQLLTKEKIKKIAALAGRNAIKESARKAAKSRNREQKEIVIARYHELLEYAHFKNGSRASIARKIASEPGITVTEITVSRWIKAETG